MSAHAASPSATSAGPPGAPPAKVASVAIISGGTMTYEDEMVTSPLCEPGLGTIIEAKEGSTSGESEHGDSPSGTPQATPVPVKKTTIESPQEPLRSKVIEVKPEAPSHPDVDGGWAWVVLVAVFLVFVITSGLLYTTGLYYVQMLTEYGRSRSYTAWMGSLTNAFFMLGGPISSSFIQRYGCRASLMLGSVLMMSGYIASAFTTSLEMLFFTYGIVIVSFAEKKNPLWIRSNPGSQADGGAAAAVNRRQVTDARNRGPAQQLWRAPALHFFLSLTCLQLSGGSNPVGASEDTKEQQVAKKSVWKNRNHHRQPSVLVM